MVKIIFYSRHAKELKGSVGAKIRTLIESDLIEYNKELKAFLIHPIKGYNKSTYTIKHHKHFGFECNCCGWQMKFKKHMANPLIAPAPSCAHVGAVYEWLARMHKARREYNIGQAVLTMFNEG